VGEAEDAITCVRELPEARPDVLVLDLRMPGVTGLEAVPEIRDASPDTRIVVYSQYIDDRTEAELREAGVEAWLKKDEDLNELRATVLSVGGLNHH
jgi:DNA-binding NarL/FixJ family response regulator